MTLGRQLVGPAMASQSLAISGGDIRPANSQHQANTALGLDNCPMWGLEFRDSNLESNAIVVISTEYQPMLECWMMNNRNIQKQISRLEVAVVDRPSFLNDDREVWTNKSLSLSDENLK